MGLMDFLTGKKEKTISEIAEENERLKEEKEQEELLLSIEQQRQLRAKLKQNGLSVNKDFGGSLKKAWGWFQSH